MKQNDILIFYVIVNDVRSKTVTSPVTYCKSKGNLLTDETMLDVDKKAIEELMNSNADGKDEQRRRRNTF